MRNVLIIGENSYIAKNIKYWLKKYPDEYRVDSVSSREGIWKQSDFTQYDTVINAAGVAHIDNISEDMRDYFYSINRDLSISMNVYGDYCGIVRDRDSENPTSFYGDSKLQGDVGIKKLEDEAFIVSYLRPPFVYGKGCKGNYKKIRTIATTTPVFPTYCNKKSIIYIDNLCEFVRMVIDEQRGGKLTPQNRELVSTSDIVKEIARWNGKNVIFTGLFNWMIKPAIKFTKIVRKAFSNDCYDLELSNYYQFSYCVVGFKESIRLTES